jgi:hypothetical protein
MDRAAFIGDFLMKLICQGSLLRLNYSQNAAGFVFLAICSIFLSCASGSFAVSKSCLIPEDFFGISPDRSPLNKEDFELLDDFNAVWIRSTIRWGGVEPEEGTWNFDYWDSYVAKAEAAKKKIVLILGFDNRWLYSDGKEHRDLTDREIPYFLKYVEQVVSRYRTRVVYEIWNEPNWVFWKGSDKHFFALSAAAAKKIREVEPGAVILAGSTSRVSKTFTGGMFKSGAMEHTDGFSVHPYATSPLGTVRQISKLQKILDKFNYEKPIWITETGYSTGPISFCNIKHYPEYIVKTLSSLAARANRVRSLIWYELMDEYNPGEIPNPLNPMNYFGLIYPNKTYKPGTEAFMLSAGYLAGAEYRPSFPLREGISKGITGFYFIRPDGTSILILWKNSPGKQNLRLIIPGAESLSRHNIHNREVVPLPAEPVLGISKDPTFITWKGGGLPRLVK